MPSTIEFVAINCQIRSTFCQFGCEVIVVPYETGGRTIRRRHAYTCLPCGPSHNHGTISPAPQHVFIALIG